LLARFGFISFLVSFRFAGPLQWPDNTAILGALSLLFPFGLPTARCQLFCRLNALQYETLGGRILDLWACTLCIWRWFTQPEVCKGRPGRWGDSQEQRKTDKERVEGGQQSAKDNDMCECAFVYLLPMLRFPNSSDNMPKCKWHSPTHTGIMLTNIKKLLAKWAFTNKLTNHINKVFTNRMGRYPTYPQLSITTVIK